MIEAGTESATGAREIVRFLVENGHRHVFGLPGSSMVAALHELQTSPVAYVPAIHESVAIAAADGYARVAGSAVTLLYMLPGLANGLANLYNAWRDESPLIVVASQQASAHRTPGWTVGEGDLVGMARPFTRLSHEVAATMPVRPWLERARRASTGALPGPAFLSMTEDAFEHFGPIAETRAPAVVAATVCDVGPVADMLRAAERPLIVVGGQLRRFGGSEAVEALAAAAAIPIVYESGFNDRLGVAPGHPNVFGSVLSGGAMLERTADAVLILGARHTLEAHPRADWFPVARFVAHVNADPAKLEETRTADWTAACDPGAFGRALARDLEACPPAPATVAAREERLTTLRAGGPPPPARQMAARFARVLPHIHDALERGWVVDEAVSASIAVLESLNSADGRRYVATTGASLGWATGAAAGVALASGEPVTCLLGDGALRFGAMGLWTIRAMDLPVTLIVLDNGGYGSTRRFERAYVARRGAGVGPGAGYLGSDLRGRGPGVAAIIEGFGIPTRQLAEGEDVRGAIEAAWAGSDNGPNALVIDIGFEG